MVAGLWEKIVVSGMVIVQMAHDHVADLVGPDVDGLEPLGDRIEHFAFALLSRRRIETGIDDEGAARPNDGPDEIIKRLEHVVGVAADKIVGRRPIMVPVADRVDFVSHLAVHISCIASADRRLSVACFRDKGISQEMRGGAG